MFASLRGTQLYFDIEGAGLVPDGPRMREKPPVMVVHGGPGGEHGGFKPVLSPLTEEMQLIYFDHRGQGRSGLADPAADASRFTLDENVEDMEALRRHLGLGQVVSFGTSYGGMVAMAHAARYPDSVSHLILAVTAAHGGFVRRAAEIVGERGNAEQQQAYARLLAGAIRTPDDMRDFFAVMGPLYSLRYDAAAAAPAVARSLYSPEPLKRAFGPGGFLHDFDLRPELARIAAPTLVLGGRHDWICAPEFSMEVAALVPGARLRIFENSSHSIRVDQPADMLAAVRDHVLGQASAVA